MITKVTKDNVGLYKALFEKASVERLNITNEDEKISSLDEYYANLADIVAGERFEYARLPLDEPTFDINLNSRVISVPEEFKKNGISVQGDQIAEIVYFLADRFIDATDLFHDDIEVWIQWETAPQTVPGSKTQVTEKGISRALRRTVISVEGNQKVLFGWALDQSITKNPGNIKFSVRFISYGDDDKINFSLSTLVATAAINASLNYKLEKNEFEGIINSQDLDIISKRIANSTMVEVDGDIDTPVFIEGLDLPSDFQLEFPELGAEPQEEIPYDCADLVDGSREFVISAEATGSVRYEWKKYVLSDDNKWVVASLTDNGGKSDTQYEFKTEDTTFQGNKVYYEYIGEVDGVKQYQVYTFGQELIGTEIPEELKEKLYEKGAMYRAASPGLYQISVYNRIGKKASETVSKQVVVPGPDRNLVTERGAGLSESIYLEDGAATVSVLGKTDRIATPTMPGDIIVYQWQVGEDAAGEVITQENTTDQAYVEQTVTVAPSESAALFDKTVKAMVTAKRNNQTLPTVEEVLFRVTDRAHAPEIAYNGLSHEITKGDEAILLTATVSNYDNIVHSKDGDGISYKWYCFTKEEGDVNLENDYEIPSEYYTVAEDGKSCTLTFDSEVTKVIIPEGEKVVDSGRYYCIATNVVNGSEAKSVIDNVEDDTVRVFIYPAGQ